MKLNELIGNALKELELAKRFDEKKNYLVDEVTLEISVSSVKSVEGGFEFKIFNVGVDADGSIEKENAHKITIKLKPKKTTTTNATEKKSSR
ncbi:MAG TPA: hypothetical protein PK431_09260 [Chitinophagales bacterium]|jgi:hypothetical protein|nr:hypothetical protein [Chitinophagales bacterium]